MPEESKKRTHACSTGGPEAEASGPAEGAFDSRAHGAERMGGLIVQ